MAQRKDANDGGKPPEFIKGAVVHYPYGEYPKVKAGDVYGYATAHSPTAVIVQWQDEAGRVHSEWFPANDVHRVSEEDWRGVPLMF